MRTHCSIQIGALLLAGAGAAMSAENPVEVDVWFTSFPMEGNASMPGVPFPKVFIGDVIDISKAHSGPETTTSWFTCESAGEEGGSCEMVDEANTTETTSTGQFRGTEVGLVDIYAKAIFAGVRNEERGFTSTDVDTGDKFNYGTVDVKSIVDLRATYEWTPSFTGSLAISDEIIVSEAGSEGGTFYVPVGVTVTIEAKASGTEVWAHAPGLDPEWSGDVTVDSSNSWRATYTPSSASFSLDGETITVTGGTSEQTLTIVAVGIDSVEVDEDSVESTSSDSLWVPVGTPYSATPYSVTTPGGDEPKVTATITPSGGEWPKDCPVWDATGGVSFDTDPADDDSILVSNAGTAGQTVTFTAECGSVTDDDDLDVVKITSVTWENDDGEEYEWFEFDADYDADAPGAGANPNVMSIDDDFVFVTNPSGYENEVVMVGDDGWDSDTAMQDVPDNELVFSLGTSDSEETKEIPAFSRDGDWGEVDSATATLTLQEEERPAQGDYSNDFPHGKLEFTVDSGTVPDPVTGEGSFEEDVIVLRINPSA